MKKIVISQSMYFPWLGMLEQIKNANIFVHYDDVQYSKGSFSNRVQFKTAQGSKWLSIPLRAQSLGQTLEEVLVDNRTDWRSHHREMLRQAYLRAPFQEDMLSIFDNAMSRPGNTLAQISRASMLVLAEYFSLTSHCCFKDVSTMCIPGNGSDRVLGVVKNIGGNIYITGHGARNYLNHDLFEAAGIEVRYMNYRCIPYPQLYGEFNPYVSALDLVANCGKDGQRFIQSESINWKTFTNGSN